MKDYRLVFSTNPSFRLERISKKPALQTHQGYHVGHFDLPLSASSPDGL
jgi:hypothetical protein